jgi:hypothetical protein
VALFGVKSETLRINTSFARDTRDSLVWPTRGWLNEVTLEVGLPPGDLKYYRATYQSQFLYTFTRLPWLTVLLNGEVGYADGYDNLPLPFFKNFYAGGTGSVRGFEAASLGPRDLNGDVLGGDRRAIANIELLFPIPGNKEKNVRLATFLDMGNVWGPREGHVTRLRASAGIAVSWDSPVGPLRFSFATPIKQAGGDKIERFQFQLGRSSEDLVRNCEAFVCGSRCWPRGGRGDMKIGFVNTERVFREAAPAKRAQQKLEREFAARNAELAKLEKQGRDLQTELERENVTHHRERAARQGAPARRHQPQLPAHAARDPRGPEPAQERGARRRAGARHARDQPDRRAGEVRPVIQEAVFASARIDITDKVIARCGQVSRLARAPQPREIVEQLGGEAVGDSAARSPAWARSIPRARPDRLPRQPRSTARSSRHARRRRDPRPRDRERHAAAAHRPTTLRVLRAHGGALQPAAA